MARPPDPPWADLVDNDSECLDQGDIIFCDDGETSEQERPHFQVEFDETVLSEDEDGFSLHQRTQPRVVILLLKPFSANQCRLLFANLNRQRETDASVLWLSQAQWLDA